jgi:energy-converting hydrogenase A subunit M
MRLHCWYCQKSITNELPKDTIFRAIGVCPECIEKHENEEQSKLRKIDKVLKSRPYAVDLDTALCMLADVVDIVNGDNDDPR